MKYSVLSTVNPALDLSHTRKLRTLASGGFDLRADARTFCPRLIGEHLDRYFERLKFASDVPLLASIVGHHVAGLAEAPLRVEASDSVDHKFYQELADDADGADTTLNDLVLAALHNALVLGTSHLAYDFPRSSDVTPENRAEEDARGLARAHVFEIPVESLIDWRRQPNGDYDWAVIRSEYSDRLTPTDPRTSAYYVEFRVWTLTPEGFARRELWRAGPYDDERAPNDNDEATLADAVTTSFRRIPIVSLELPQELQLGALVGPLAAEHFERRSSLNAAISRTLVPLPVYKLGSEIGASGLPLPSEVQQNPNRGQSDPAQEMAARGYLVLGAGDDLSFVAPDPSTFSLVDKILLDLEDACYRVGHAHAASPSMSTSAIDRSGVSKLADQKAAVSYQRRVGGLARNAVRRLLDGIASARGEHATWTLGGLEPQPIVDRAELLKEVSTPLAITSPTARAAVELDAIERLLPNASPALMKTIATELANVTV